ncbi:uncharacterized protein A4U43_C01F20850 [Asparagus officinalis]|uniref:Uncharacterized protein n=1 Tax=Asparagus officinalis TaxID=4686 RepID=A0A5P1FQX8_ASPOF|nr:uncharacterized protein A4U43_C01F20850 [Asparagus officinalis]
MHLSSNSSYNNNYGQKPPVLEEFIPITSTGPDKPATTASEKPNWMLSAQLWSPPSDPSPKPIDTNKNRNGGAFLPFSKEKANGNNNNSNKGVGIGFNGFPPIWLLASLKKEVEVVGEVTDSVPRDSGRWKREQEGEAVLVAGLAPAICQCSSDVGGLSR